MFFVSMMDKENADFEGVYEDIKNRLTDKVIPVEIPIGEGEDFHGIINLFSERAHLYKPGTVTGEYDEEDIPEEYQEKFERWETELQETLATTSEELLETYLEGGHISRDEAIEAMARAMARGELYPLFCGSPLRTYGSHALLRKMVELFPSPAETGGESARRPGLDQQVQLQAADDGPLAALVFKTATEPHVGELSFFRIYSGRMDNGMEVYNAANGTTEKLGHLSVPMGRDRFEVARLHAGDIGVVAKLKQTHTNDTLCGEERSLELEKIEFPKPDIAVAIHGASRNDDDKLGEVLPRLHEEDPTFIADFDPELHQTIARGLGELHLTVQIERMQRKYNVNVETEQPKIAYRETIRRTAEAQGRFKKQTGGRGQFGDCHLRVKPLPRGQGYEFVDSIKGGVIPNKFIPSVDKGVQEAAQKGVLAGYPMVDLQVECYDGSYHSVDSSDVAFQVAGSIAFKKAAEQAGVTLLEPIMEVEVTTPEEFMGDIMGDITQRRGRVLGMDSLEGRTIIRAQIPAAELYKYAASLRSMTQGRAFHSRKPMGYEPVPETETQKIIQDRERELAEVS
jgi:elongation factor G